MKEVKKKKTTNERKKNAEHFYDKWRKIAQTKLTQRMR